MTAIDYHSFRAISALDAQKRRRPAGRVIEDGEALSFNIALVRDAAMARTGRTYITDAERTSIDATVKAEIEKRAKLVNQKPSEFLASLAPRDLERMIEQAAKAHVAAIGNEAVAKSFALDSASITRRADFTRSLAAARFADGAKLIDMPEGPTRAIGTTASAHAAAATQDAGRARASIDALRAARYSGE